MVSKSRKTLEGLGALPTSSDIASKKANESVPAPISEYKSPAMRAATGEKRIESKYEQLTNALEEANAARLKAESQRSTMTIKMPVTGQVVEFRQQEIPVDNIVVPQINGRRQSLLDALSLSDILPSIKKEGQQRPGYVYPIGDGTFGSLDGSRRLASCKLAGIPNYIALVGEVPEADRAKFSENENKNSALSYWEQSQNFGHLIEVGAYKNWHQLCVAHDIPTADESRFKALYEIPELYASIFTTPTDMQKSFGEEIGKLKRKNESQLVEAAENLRKLRAEALESGEPWKDAADILKILKSSVRSKPAVEIDVKARKPKTYEIGPSKVPVKHSRSKTTGAIKFEINANGLSDEDVAAVEQAILKALKVS
tara:strand:+ start:25628 stop:26737 length:1110 start_codon:yes stop_codon:yes gene_type:complete